MINSLETLTNKQLTENIAYIHTRWIFSMKKITFMAKKNKIVRTPHLAAPRGEGAGT